MRYSIEAEGICPQVNKHLTAFEVEASNAEEARQIALDRIEAGKVRWIREVDERRRAEISLESLEITQVV